MATKQIALVPDEHIFWDLELMIPSGAGPNAFVESDARLGLDS